MHELNLTAVHDKAQTYQALLPQIQALIADDADLPAAVYANTAAALKEAFGWLWVGFYLVNETETELQLGPFQGPVACSRIAKGRGVCGQAWAQAQTLVVPDVNAHPDHIACSSLSQSEIVVPLLDAQGRVRAVLDADSAALATFDHIDAEYLQQLCAIVSACLYPAR